MLRRRSRSTPTDDLELTAQRPVGVVGEDTSEELVLAAVDGELVQPCARPPVDAPPPRACDARGLRLDVSADRRPRGCRDRNHRNAPLAGPPGPQARVRRRFRVKGGLAGFLIATGALIRRTVFRAAHRGATVHHTAAAAPVRCATPSRASPSPARPSPLPSSRRTHCRAVRAARHRRRVGPGRSAPRLGATQFGPENGERSAGADLGWLRQRIGRRRSRLGNWVWRTVARIPAARAPRVGAEPRRCSAVPSAVDRHQAPAGSRPG